MCVVALDEASRATHHEQAHDLAPVVRISALLEGGERVQRALVFLHELVRLAIAVAAQVFLRADADGGVAFEKEAQLAAEVEVAGVVGRGRQQDTATVVSCDVVADFTPGLAFAIAQVVAFVDDDQSVPS